MEKSKGKQEEGELIRLHDGLYELDIDKQQTPTGIELRKDEKPEDKESIVRTRDSDLLLDLFFSI